MTVKNSGDADGASGAVELVIPEDLTTLSDEDLSALHSSAVESFNAVYGDGAGLSSADVEALAALTEGIEALSAESATRAEAAAARDAAAAALAVRVNPSGADSDGDGDAQEEATDAAASDEPASGEEGDDAAGDDVEVVVNAVAASARRPAIRVNLGALPRRVPAPRDRGGLEDVLLAAGDGTGFAAGTGIDWADAADIFERRLQGFPESSLAAASAAGRHVSQRLGLLSFRKPIPADHMVASADPSEIMSVMDRASDERNLPGGSLTAAGGWCAPSEILYDTGCERESRDGLFTLPEIGVRRGGIQWTQGIDFSTIYAGSGFAFTEEDDIAGEYAIGEGGVPEVGDKPCYRIPCASFLEARLAVAGLCLTGGLLQMRGYPELVARTIRGALVAHDHKMSANALAAVIAGSTAVTYPARVGAVAPLLDSIEQQVEHYRTVHRMRRAESLEIVLPFWARGALRSDLARRLGVDLISVSDSRIDAWIRNLGVSLQYVYGLDPLTGAANAFLEWPASVRFLLYSAGAWVKGGSEIITLDTLYDSVLLGQNDYLALFSEEGWLVAQRCSDSRVVSVPLCASGATGAGVDIDCDGTAIVVAP